MRFRVALIVLAWSLSAAADDEKQPGVEKAQQQEQEEVRWRDIKNMKSDDRRSLQKFDTTYGRIEGDLSVVVGLGATIAPRGPRLAGDLRFRYIDTVGLFVSYEDGAIVKSDADPRRVLAFGAELRPLFLARWLRGMEFESPRLDLALDSFGLELGGFVEQPQGAAFGSRPGLQTGIGLELPILAHASGPWLGIHAGVRWSDAALSGDTLRGPSDRSTYLTLTVSWHQFFGAHVVDVGDRAPE